MIAHGPEYVLQAPLDIKLTIDDWSTQSVVVLGAKTLKLPIICASPPIFMKNVDFCGGVRRKSPSLGRS